MGQLPQTSRQTGSKYIIHIKLLQSVQRKKIWQIRKVTVPLQMKYLQKKSGQIIEQQEWTCIIQSQ